MKAVNYKTTSLYSIIEKVKEKIKMRQLSGIKVFLFGFLGYVSLTLFLNLFFGFEQWNREFKFIFMFFVMWTVSIFLNKGYFDKFLSKKIK